MSAAPGWTLIWTTWTSRLLEIFASVAAGDEKQNPNQSELNDFVCGAHQRNLIEVCRKVVHCLCRSERNSEPNDYQAPNVSSDSDDPDGEADSSGKERG